jgi:hypothetical protein
MRTIGPSLIFVGFVLGALAFAAAPATPLATLAELATDFSSGEASSALDKFDSKMPAYGEISNNIQALIDQTEVTCAIEIISDTESGGVHKLDLDWIMNLKSMGDNLTVERRREEVTVEMRQVKGKWKITALSPLKILDPIHII